MRMVTLQRWPALWLLAFVALPLGGCDGVVGSAFSVPSLVSTVPTEGAVRVSRRTALSIGFSEPMDRDTVTLTGSPELPVGNLIWGDEMTSVVFMPKAPFDPATHYTVEVVGKSSGGKALGGNVSFSFETDNAAEPDDFTLQTSTPADGARDVAALSEVVLTFTQAVDVANTGAKLLPEGMDLSSIAVEDEGRTLRFAVTTALKANADYQVQLRARSVGGVELAPGLRVAFRTGGVMDKRPPAIIGASPVTGMTGVSSNAAIAVSFSEPMDKASVEGALVSTPAVGCVGRWVWNANATLLSCSPQPPLAVNTRYQLTVGAAAKDLAGNQMTAAVSWSFTTGAGADTVAPTVKAFTPSGGTQGVARNELIKVTFSEPMDLASTQAAFSISSPTGATGTFVWTNNNTVLNFVPAVPLPYGQEVAWSLSTSAKDVAGNALSGAAVQAGFRVARYATVRLISLPNFDGVLRSNRTGDGQKELVPAGDGADNVVRFDYFSFDLSPIPGNTKAIVSATFGVYQTAAVGTPYTKLGNLLADHIFYGTLDTEDFFLQAAGTYTLSTTATTGYKTVSVVPKVKDDLADRFNRGNACQFRVRFPFGPADGVDDYVGILMSETATHKPYLDIAYEYP